MKSTGNSLLHHLLQSIRHLGSSRLKKINLIKFLVMENYQNTALKGGRIIFCAVILKFCNHLKDDAQYNG